MKRTVSKATPYEISSLFPTSEPFKKVAARLGMSPNTLRKKWVEEFGKEMFKARGKAIQAAAASKTAKSISKTRVYKKVPVTCTECQTDVLLSSNAVAQLEVGSFVCDDCKYDRSCPVCGKLVNGVRGLSTHFRHQRDEAHAEHQRKVALSLWEGKAEDVDYVVCRLCGHKAETLARHLKASHEVTAEQYKEKFPGAPIRSQKLTQARSESIRNREAGFGKGEMKTVGCPSCGELREGSKFLVPDVHDFRCPSCQEKEEEARWEGKTEPEDYVECRLCGWKGLNLTGHLWGAHPEVSPKNYGQEFPTAPWFVSGSYQHQPSANKLNLTEKDLEPFKDKKGRVQVALAADTLGCAGLTVRNYCKELKIPTRNRLAFQKRVMDAVADLLGEPYEWEWSDGRITNPKTGYRFYFDGYFPKHNLLVEVQGKQHYVYIPYWHKAKYVFEEMQERDREKWKQAKALGFNLLTVRWDEPYMDAGYLEKRVGEVLG